MTTSFDDLASWQSGKTGSDARKSLEDKSQVKLKAIHENIRLLFLLHLLTWLHSRVVTQSVVRATCLKTTGRCFACKESRPNTISICLVGRKAYQQLKSGSGPCMQQDHKLPDDYWDATLSLSKYQVSHRWRKQVKASTGASAGLHLGSAKDVQCI